MYVVSSSDETVGGGTRVDRRKCNGLRGEMRVAREKGSSRRACRRSNRRSLLRSLCEDQDSSLDHKDYRSGMDD